MEDDDEMGRTCVNIGRWEQRDDFYQHFGVTSGCMLPEESFEAAHRRREWLACITEDSEVANSAGRALMKHA